MFNIGDIINNRYILLDIIGEGNFSTVWIAFDIKNNDYFSVKIINDEDIEIIGENELSIIKYIKKHISSKEQYKKNLLLYENILSSSNKIIIIEKFQNITLRDLFDNYILTDNDKNILLTKMEDIKGAIILLNNNKILHTDIKPENIFIEITDNKLYNLNNEIKDCINKLINYTNKKNKKINKLKLYNEIISEYSKTLKKKFEEQINNIETENNETTENSENNILTDSDIHSDFNIQDNIDEFLNNTIMNNYNSESSINNENNKKNIDFNLNNIKLSLGDFGNAINYNNEEEYEQLKTGKYHDMQTRYYRDPNIILRNNDIFNTDLFAYNMVIEEIKHNKIIINPKKTYFYTTDHQHLKKLIDNNKNIDFLKKYNINGRKLNIFFEYDKLLNGYFLKK